MYEYAVPGAPFGVPCSRSNIGQTHFFSTFAFPSFRAFGLLLADCTSMFVQQGQAVLTDLCARLWSKRVPGEEDLCNLPEVGAVSICCSVPAKRFLGLKCT